ncbi:MAG: hypothetical protein A2889_04075 [Nitrospinae bacterium RIFCSPLOWO2_01_FULL_39_10]|nr:MAG: hypothetical protein A2889_04075 [Nitrospinae bacterium RIFCSPLOWO2_01_FULL_39_10]
MKAMVKKEGLLIPRKLLKGIKEAEIKCEKDKIVILPTRVEEDPIFNLGRHPGHSGLKDASIHHDNYL